MLQVDDYFFRQPAYQHITMIQMYVKTYVQNAVIVFFKSKGIMNTKFKIVVGESLRDTIGKKHELTEVINVLVLEVKSNKDQFTEGQ